MQKSFKSHGYLKQKTSEHAVGDSFPFLNFFGLFFSSSSFTAQWICPSPSLLGRRSRMYLDQ